MKKRPLLKSLISLISVSLIVKIVATIAKVTTTRVVGVEAMGLYMLVNPTMVFLINITQLSLPVVIAKLIASKMNQKKVLITTSVILFIVTITSMILILSFSDIFATNILRNSDCKYPLQALALLIPLISIGSIIKGYYIGNNNVEITAKSQISEEIGRFVFIIAFGSTFLNISIPFAATCCIYSLCFGEICSLTHMFIKLNNKDKIKSMNIKQELFDKDNYMIKEVLNVSLPLTSSKIISSFTYFLEPIILTFLLMKYGYTTSQISTEYGILNGYAMPLIMMPAFFSGVYGKILMPEMSKLIAENKYQKSYSLFKKFIMITLYTGLAFSIFIMLFRHQLLKILYGSNLGENYILLLTIPFILYYLESPISAAMTALSLNKQTFKIGLSGALVRLFVLIMTLEPLNIMAVAISELSGVIVYIVMGLYYILKEFFLHDIHSIFFKKSKKNLTNTDTIKCTN